jgi:hypothetical protein
MPKGTAKGAEQWPMDDLLESVMEVSAVSNSRKNYDPRWTVVLATFVGVYRDEDAKIKYRENWKPDDSGKPNNKPAIPQSRVSCNPYARVKRGEEYGE